ncbi:MAG: hypothetical protein MR469_02100 [Campylobacter sp.]|uniref:hypothetical protein n=1 Tax=Campylobacter sp. TaxID=205 RepID=UPI002AA7F940|nr:hypothetical protein [Campylobacter sp.]MCI6694416.1 hypothetical protein [Campylobacter sp.]MCI6818729.1 hypothetical protein [Campylobacter sp.]
MIFLLLLPFFILIFVVLLPAVWSLAIYGALLIFRSRLRYINETKAKKLLIFGSIATLFIIWELEVPQQVIFNNLTKHSTARYMYDIEIVDDNYTLPVDYKRFSVGYAEPYYDCVDYFINVLCCLCHINLSTMWMKTEMEKKVMIAKLYGPYYGKTFLMMYLENLVVKRSNYRSKYVDDKDIYKKLEILKFKQQKGENNENK